MSAALQSREDERACGMQARVSELEALVCAAYGRGVEAARCRDVIEDAVRRARRKGAMLQHLDSSLLLSTLEQAKSEIASLTDVAATNAEVMQEELLHHQARLCEREEDRGGEDSEDVAAASVVSVPASSVAAPPSAAASSEAAAPSSPTGPHAEDSPAAVDIEEVLSFHACLNAGQYAANASLPFVQAAVEVEEAAVEIEEVRSFRHSMSMRAPRKGESEKVAAYDFDVAMSPRASYHIRDAPFHRAAEPEFSFGRSQMDMSLDEAVAAVAAVEKQEDQEEPEEDRAGSPLLVYSRTPDAQAAAGRRDSLERYFSAVDTVEEEEEEGEEEGQGREEVAAGTAGAAAAQEQVAAAARPPAAPRPYSPHGRPYSPHGRRLSADSALSPWVRAQRREMGRQRSRSAEEAHSWAAMPPGFYPGATVEGSAFGAAAALDRDMIDPSSPLCAHHMLPLWLDLQGSAFGAAAAVDRDMIDPSSPTGVGTLDLESYNSAPFTLHSVTPPRHVMAELAAEVQGRLRM
ncbi:hypothetical protein COHA_004278 [Chlorella ohadii]|uniref:Uncharacterized protein n=1 Tax=Chlorella ohadii TaxID=2649997 RepID=A0AAD5DTH0_9CHLO|nr:hypothetical protein COHA_004278 [Chlorella ohadii]